MVLIINLKQLLTIVILLISVNSSFSQIQETNNIDSLSVFFDFADYKVMNKYSINLIKSIKLNQDEHIILKGYTDTIGSINYNRKLARLRIDEVYRLLIVNNPNANIKIENYNENNHFRRLNDSLYRRVDLIRTIPNNKISIVFGIPIILKINFYSGTDNFTDDSYSSLDELLQIMINDTNLKIELRGHVCCHSNYELSYKRALKVKKYLTFNGIHLSRINTIGLSNSKHLVKEITEKDMEKNMRVEVVFNK